MTMRMLIDARHHEETRVAVVKGNRIEEFDFESSEHKQLKGNIYLAKVTRVEPSLQAAFVDYGGNRHGFLAFSEIHPDYYQIPKEDREALLREEAEHAAEEERLRAAEDSRYESDEDDDGFEADSGPVEEIGAGGGDESDVQDDAAPAKPENASGSEESAADELRRKRQALRRRYKIQDVIRRRQVLLVQVVKEERGNKGAALTTYLSLAGRYCVLMPNTSHGGGISRKISNGADRKRLKQIMADLALPTSMGLIVRTAGLSRTKTEIKRDFDYLARLWDEIRERTLGSAAPALIYGDSDLVKRAIRDIYNRDIDEVIVEGEDGYRAARSFMKLLMPSHVKKVRGYSDPVPLFQRFGVEDQLAAMYQPVVQLKSGGYLVINPTEALVSIDINSGRSTREHNIEQTAYATNIEAAHEIARQLRLRDMAGLVVIDFIDMESNGHIRKVEKAMKEALKNDRARIQVGRISSFGLMEMSRQRLRTGVLEASTKPCQHCEGTGLMRTASSAGLSALRMIEDEAGRGRGSRILLRAGREAAIYVLNRKRAEIAEVEDRYGVIVEVLIEEGLEGARMAVESHGPPPTVRPRFEPIAPPVYDEDEEDLPEEEEEELEEEAEDEAAEEEPREQRRERGERPERDEGGERGRKRRRRRGRRGGRRREGEEGRDEQGEGTGADAEQPEADDSMTAEATTAEAAPAAPIEEAPAAEEAPTAEEKPKTRRRPRARKKADAADAPEAVAAEAAPVEAIAAAAEVAPEAPAEAPAAEEEAAKPKRRSRRKKADEAQPAEAAAEPAAEPEAPAAKRRSRRKAAPAEAAPVETPAPAAANDPAESADESGAEAAAADEGGESAPPRRGWWQRTFGN
ncbi:ribonuclease E/G [Sphingosinicella sp. BN140058]|uniref:Rne/Rng family ribonuclease n=1 Tax=Sphingosinicella sp. BN140058 TaxID=1892855 RepID=UPI0010117B80|nr:ribonuclease E/G [Sphingosinicella sp. BN140058]QAY75774.1 ribonuclease E/G [Sphingosinicella sp. BN140058]